MILVIVRGVIISVTTIVINHHQSAPTTINQYYNQLVSIISHYCRQSSLYSITTIIITNSITINHHRSALSVIIVINIMSVMVNH